MTVARNMSCYDVAGMPCVRRTRIAYSRLEHDDSSMHGHVVGGCHPAIHNDAKDWLSA